MPILATRTAKETRTKESDEPVSELLSGIWRFRSGGVAPAALDRTLADSAGVLAFNRLQTAPRAPIGLAQRETSASEIVPYGAPECPIRIRAYGFHLGGRCAR
jgi:hypothetical protein